MLHRKYPPNAGKWNGLGGKIHPSETPLECAKREVMEEAGIDLERLGEPRFTGIVTWNSGADPTSDSRGMSAFVAELAQNRSVEERDTPEGLLAWKPLGWVCDRDNDSVVGNIPRFLLAMLTSEHPMEYRCEYRDEFLVSIAASPL